MEKSEKMVYPDKCPNTYFHTMESNVCIPQETFLLTFSSFFCIFNLTILLIPKTWLFLFIIIPSPGTVQRIGQRPIPTGNHPSSLKTSNHNRLWPVITIFKNNEIMQVNCRSEGNNHWTSDISTARYVLQIYLPCSTKYCFDPVYSLLHVIRIAPLYLSIQFKKYFQIHVKHCSSLHHSKCDFVLTLHI